ncbi:MAG: hypothetical protein QM820_16245 [Minicystis sp.]
MLGTGTAHRRVTSALVGIAVALGAASALADNEMVVYGVSNFGGTGECSGDPLPSFSTEVDTIRSRFDGWIAAGDWDVARSFKNTGLDKIDLADSTKLTGGADSSSPGGIDSTDVGFVLTHGAAEWSSGRVYSRWVMGSDSYGSGSWTDCRVFTDTDVSWGNGGTNDLEIFISRACQSAQYEVWRAGVTDATVPAYFAVRTTSGTLSTYLGFHGDAYSGASHVTEMDNFVQHSLHDGIGENWIDYLYDPDPGANDDQCPSAIVFGSTATARDHMYTWGGFRDREDTGTKGVATYYYIKGCDPLNGQALPN